MNPHSRRVLFASSRSDWETPPELFAHYDAIHRFTLDVCASATNTKVPRYYNEAADGLAQPWAPEICWMNPPYARGVTGRWVAKAAWEAEAGALVVCLLPARTDSRWWHRFVWLGLEPRPGVRVEFLQGRVRFVGASSGAPFPSVIVTFFPFLNSLT